MRFFPKWISFTHGLLSLIWESLQNKILNYVGHNFIEIVLIGRKDWRVKSKVYCQVQRPKAIPWPERGVPDTCWSVETLVYWAWCPSLCASDSGRRQWSGQSVVGDPRSLRGVSEHNKDKQPVLSTVSKIEKKLKKEQIDTLQFLHLLALFLPVPRTYIMIIRRSFTIYLQLLILYIIIIIICHYFRPSFPG